MTETNLKEVLKKQQNYTKNSEKENIEDTLQVIGFVVGDEEFAIPILNVIEIVKPIEYTRVPGTPNYVLGVFNLRGNVFPLINLRLKFGLSAIAQDKDTRYLVIKHEDKTAGFVIDKLTEAIRLKHSEIDSIPESFDEQENLMQSMQGIGKRDNRLITILKTEILLKKTF
ncbi:chemotaxis protein CheW [Helicobacter mustelae]|uniref:Chemotaxis protein n=1 Tax=Helicobacter mustelae (strain ATCC 43772 / CCUG 25715 / CIP 103759 / LMG 18044 / NCTC 12198 / R85-136P) TaxID=679897 RepID=D3UGL7_HELM1|nr:chemotaxis protein CheW [Helicobacter mustelae]CBG39638.1 chemotaxis protein [Helicobacter mustelae 12198]SQH71149.1 chemotaxis protein [Helicobacter mustelae]STP12277.1 chemotaxis protein [Helicobacter mustelae]